VKIGHGGSVIKTTPGLAPRNPGKKRGRKNQNELLMECGKLMIDSDKMKDLASYPLLIFKYEVYILEY